MLDTEITRKKIDELLAFLPIFESEGFNPVKEWNLEGIPYPTYDEQVRNFFLSLARDPWPESTTAVGNYHEALTADTFFETASLCQVGSLLNYCCRMERFCYGFWGTLISRGRLTCLLRRLAELRDV